VLQLLEDIKVNREAPRAGGNKKIVVSGGIYTSTVRLYACTPLPIRGVYTLVVLKHPDLLYIFCCAATIVAQEGRFDSFFSIQILL
jgi:hypothetical protein